MYIQYAGFNVAVGSRIYNSERHYPRKPLTKKKEDSTVSSTVGPKTWW